MYKYILTNTGGLERLRARHPRPPWSPTLTLHCNQLLKMAVFLPPSYFNFALIFLGFGVLGSIMHCAPHGVMSIYKNQMSQAKPLWEDKSLRLSHTVLSSAVSMQSHAASRIFVCFLPSLI